jgi:hypothetical protein
MKTEEQVGADPARQQVTLHWVSVPEVMRIIADLLEPGMEPASLRIQSIRGGPTFVLSSGKSAKVRRHLRKAARILEGSQDDVD